MAARVVVLAGALALVPLDGLLAVVVVDPVQNAAEDAGDFPAPAGVLACAGRKPLILIATENDVQQLAQRNADVDDVQLRRQLLGRLAGDFTFVGLKRLLAMVLVDPA